MTDISETILQTYQIRKSKQQKAGFRQYATALAEESGYACREEKGYLGAKNLVIGDPDTAEVVFTAHYDTCARLPFPNFITPKRVDIYILYQLALTLVLFIVPMVLTSALTFLVMDALPVELPAEVADSIAFFVSYLALLLICLFVLSGPANEHTANDNTSGTVTVLELMRAVPEESRDRVAFILFDLEEAGVFGSMGYAAKHKKQMKDTLLINFDCVSDGKNMLFALRPGAKKFADRLAEAYPENETFHVSVLSKGVFYPSDQANFPCGVGVAALKKSKRGIEYMDRIHTKKDTEFQAENIAFLVEGSLRLIKNENKPVA